MRVLIVLTSCGRSPAGGKIGFWLEDFAAAYYAFAGHGLEVILASPAGGMPPIDPRSDDVENPDVARFRQDRDLRTALSDSLQLSQVAPEDFACAFYPGGAGALWDLPGDRSSQVIISAFRHGGRPLGLVGHAPALLCRLPISGRRVTGLTDEEQGDEPVPFSLQQELARLGARFEHGQAGAAFAVQDGWLVTGQNPASTEIVVQILIAALG